MTIVLDTNVIVSGLLQPKGNPAQVLALALAGAVQVAHDERILPNTKKCFLARGSSLTRKRSAKC